MVSSRHLHMILLLVSSLLLFQQGVGVETGSGGMLMPFTEEPDNDNGTVSEGSGAQPPIEGSGSGGGLEPDIITCSNPADQVIISSFESIATSLNIFECSLDTENSNSTGLLFIIGLPTGETIMVTDEIGSRLLLDEFNEGLIVFMVTVCSYTDGMEDCDGEYVVELGSVSVTLTSHQDRLLPYGEVTEDSSFRNVLDGAVSIQLPQTIPFYSTYYHSLYVSSNGLVSFNQPYLSWWPVPFPYGRTLTAIIAPFWTDLDFRNTNTDTSKIYYNTYANDSRRSGRFLNLFAERLESYVGADTGFKPEWMTVITWNEATPYYWRSYSGQSLTFQLVLATDYISTYAFYLYPPGGFNVQLPRWRRVVIGHDPKDYKNYHNVELRGGTQYTMMDTITGNTGQLGQWYYNFTSSESDANSEQLCLEWSRKERLGMNNTLETHFTGLPSCPCTQQQARRDWRFWFANFWGLSSRPNCSTFLWSRRQATIECCYDTDGSLLVGPSAGGSYLLYNPLFHFESYFREDRLPYQRCCENSDRCDLFYTHRPSDDCSNYVPPRRFFIFGDPHFQSIDDRNFTFNGIGEYLLLESAANNLIIQARLEQFDANTPGTVTTSIAFLEGSSPPIQVNVEASSFVLYVGSNKTDLPGTGSAIIIGSSGVTDINTVNTGTMVAMNLNEIFIRREDNNGQDTLTITTPAGGSLSVTLDNSFLGIAVELSENFRNQTRGLMGVFNGDGSDDFTLPNGTVLDISQEENIYQFGLEWHLGEQDSLFSYGDDQNYSSLNDGYLDFVPTFFDELNITQDVMDACGSNQACILDASLTGSVDIGTSTLDKSMENKELEEILDNKPPKVTSGVFTLVVITMENVTATYEVKDPDGDDIISLELKGIESTGIAYSSKITGPTATLELTWHNPGYSLPSEEIRIVAIDKNDASTSRRISIVLCGCMSNGNCSELIDTTLFNVQGHHKLLCDCPLFFGGDSCEVDMRGCGFDVCPDYAVCMNDSTVDSGYTCSNCSEGYELIADPLLPENKCSDLDECSSTSTNNCSQVCVNTEGSYTCDCMPGYRLTADGFTCQDFDECFEDDDDCDQICTNTDGGFSCSCFSGYVRMTDECELATCTNVINPCDLDTMCATTEIAGIFQCVCPIGEMCMGLCAGTQTDVSGTSQSCRGCTGSNYGYNCTETCNCLNGGTCDPQIGCVCVQGEWTGTDCSIEVNDYTPVFNDNSFTLNGQIRWDLPAEALVATVVAIDNDTNPNSGSIQYSLIKSQYQLSSGIADGFEYFAINSSTGEITNTMALADIYRTLEISSFVLNIAARDRGVAPKSSETTATITPLSVTMLPSSIATIIVQENTPIGSIVSDAFECTELGPSSGSLTLSMNSPNSGPFMIDQDTSSLAVARDINFETISNTLFSLAVVCTNRHQISDTLVFQVEIENVDDNRFMFDMPSYSVEIPENISDSVVVLTVQAFDLDSPNVNVVYTIIDGNVPELHISMFDGAIRTTSVGLDRERIETYKFRVEARLATPGINNVSVVTANVTIKLTDINDNAPYFIESDVYIDELLSHNAIGDIVLTVLARDDDIGSNGDISYGLEQNDYFVINETTGIVYVNSLQLIPRSTIRIYVYASDNGDKPMTSNGTIIVYVRPSPDRLRFGENRYLFNITENNARGFIVGSVEAVIVDVLNSTFNESSEHQVEYEIINGTFTSIFVISRQSGEIFLLTSLDYETAQEYDLTVRASLSSQENITKDVVVRVTVVNQNDNAPMLLSSFYTAAVEESAPAGTSLLQVSAIDIDNIDSVNIAYRLDGSPDTNNFNIDSLGTVSARSVLTNIRDYRFNVIASDGELESEAVIFISVTRSSSVSLTFTKEKYIFNISENVLPGSYIGSVAALTNGSIPSDEFPHLGFRIFSPDMPSMNDSTTGSFFHIDRISGDISTLAVAEFDAESQRVFVFYVEVFNIDNVIVYDTAAVEVQLADVNDNRPIFSQSLYTKVINTTQPINSVILTVSAIDRDAEAINSDVEYSIISGPLGFALQAVTGDLSVTNSTLIPGEYYLTIEGSDGGRPALNGSATIFVAVMPAIPTRIEFNETLYYFSIPENAELGALVGIVRAFDSNPNITSTLDSIVYSTPNVTRCFTLDRLDGEIRVSCVLDREMVPQFELQIVASVVSPSGDVIGYSKVIINILDINDKKPVFSLDVYATVINDNHGNDTVLQVTASDADSGSNAAIEYSVNDPEGNATEYFKIDNSTGIITLSGSIVPIGDYRVIAVATDLGISVRMSSTAVVLICVTRSQPGHIGFQTISFSISENLPGETSVGTVLLSSGIQNIVPSEFPNNLEFRFGVDNIYFRIESITGELFTIQTLDRETASSHVLHIVADFTAFNISALRVVTIHVTDKNDVTPVFTPSGYATTIDDNANMDDVIINITTMDYDVGDNARVTFSIEGADSDFPFDVISFQFNPPITRGQIIVSNISNLIPKTYEFQILGTDNGSPFLTRTADVTIIVEHALPETISFPTPMYVFNFTENMMLGTFVGNISVVQVTPALDELDYEISGGNSGFFHLDPNTRTLTNARLIDREANATFTISVRAMLFDAPQLLLAETMVTVNILDVNDEIPIFSNGGSYSRTIFTNEVSTTVSIISVLARDEDEGSNADILYSITDGNDLELFRIDQTGAIFPTIAPLNASTYLLSVTAEDMGDNVLSSTANVAIVIQNAIPNSINFLQTNGYNFSINENSDHIIAIGQVSLEAIQPQDLQNFIRFSVPSDTFRIDQNGNINSNGLLDFEVAHSYTLNITATLDIPIKRFTPKVTLTTTVQVIIFVVDLNDNSPVFNNFPYNVEQSEERTTEEVVATITATDADSGSNQQLVYTLLNTDSSIMNSFRVDSSSGELFAAAGIDREVQEAYFLLIRVCDMGNSPNCITATINFTLLDINDNTPQLNSGTTYEVRERLPAGTTAFTLSASDPDAGSNGVNSLRYLSPPNLIGSSGLSYGNRGGSIFSIDEQTGVVSLRVELDYETESYYTTSIRVRDRWFNTADTSSGSRRSDTNIRINVINEPDNDPQFSLPTGQDMYQVTLNPMLSSGHTIHDVEATDADPNDQLSYEIEFIMEEGNNEEQPLFVIDRTSGRVYLEDDQTFTPEARFTLSIIVYDNSQFNLTDNVFLIVEILPEQLQFEQPSYTVDISEGVDIGSVLARLSIQQLSVSSDITYVLDVTSPSNQDGAFTVPGGSSTQAVISLASGEGLDRENIDEYRMTITAQRTVPTEQTAVITLVINVLDVNDNRPTFIDGENPVINVDEETLSQTQVSKINVTDRDIGENGRIQYTVDAAPLGFPFSLDRNTGILTVIGDIDYEEVQSFEMTVTARDSSADSTSFSSSQTYSIQINNINDNIPKFLAVAYFGEMSSESVSGDIVHHIVLTVTDDDDVNSEQDLSFEITFSEQSADAAAGYALEVAEDPPYRIRIINIPENVGTVPKLLSLRLKVSDGDLSTTIPLYIYVFVSDNLVTFNLRGVSIEEFESCVNDFTSLCNFLDVLGMVVTAQLSASNAVFFSNHSLVALASDTITLEVYGWYGSEYNTARDNNGELSSSTAPNINYVFYSRSVATFTAAASSDEFFPFSFGVEVDETTVAPLPEELNPIILIAVACGVVVGVLCLVLTIVVVCVLKCRKRNEPRPKRRRKPSDPYLRKRREPRSRRQKSRRGSYDDLALTPRGGSDLAYETMYDDDDILDSKQTMPWFDPKYLATDEQRYDGDTEQSQRKTNVRATVDGNARRQSRRYSSDESAAQESSAEVETYLDQYQQSTPIKPGQNMGEFDMFANSREDDRPFRPSLGDYNWEGQQRH